MSTHKKSVLIAALVVMTLSFHVAPAFASDWSEPVVVNRRREGMVVSYRAKIDAGYLVVEAKHGKGWHTYTMDNVARAQKKSGKEKPETELPTVIEVSGGLKTSGDWFQSTPKDLSMVSIKWYTWGFVDTSYFAIKAEAIDGPTARLTISAQACNASSCSMVDDETIVLTLPDALPETISKTPPLAEKSFVRVGDKEVYKKL
jgi:hypothetical protein